MAAYRTGNDIRIYWTIIDSEGHPYNLEGHNLHLWMKVGMTQFEITDYSVADNVITWVFHGKDQSKCRIGRYEAILAENYGETGMAMLDTQEVFTLVAHSWESSAGDGVRVRTEPVVNIQSQLLASLEQLCITKAEFEAIFGPGSATHGESGMETSDVLASVKDYIDEEDSKYLPLAGGTMSGQLVIPNNVPIITDRGTKLIEEERAGEKRVVIGDNETPDDTIIKTPGHVLKIDGEGDLHPILDTSAQELTDAQKAQARANIGALSPEEADSYFVPKTGGVFTGPVDMSGGVTANGLTLAGQRIRNVGTPTSNFDAATKKYVDDAVNPIEDKIPSAASSSNQLADKAFVNSSIQTETAVFQGNWDEWSDVLNTIGKEFPGGRPDNNDYLVVRDASGYAPRWNEDTDYSEDDYVVYNIVGTDWNIYKCISDVQSSTTPDNDTTHWEEVDANPNYSGTWKFKYSGEGGSNYDSTRWLPEYQINEEPLTQAQLDALNSGITANKVSKLDALPTNSELETALGGKQETLVSGTNIKTLNNESLLGSGNISLPQEVFWATYGVTTYQQIVDAYNAGKLVACRYNNNNYTLATLSYGGSAWFGGTAGQTYRLRCNIDDSSWGADTFYSENSGNRQNSMPSNPDNYHYLSTKAVADAFGKKGVISQTQNWSGTDSTGYSYSMSGQTVGLIPQSFIDLVTAAGATFNPNGYQTGVGYFELNGLTDISYEEMRYIFNVLSATVVEGGLGGEILRAEIKPRTFFPLANGGAKGFSYAFYGSNRKLEVIEVGQSLYVSAATSMFESCYYLRAFGLNNAWTAQFSSTPTNMFRKCYSLETVKINTLGRDISFSDSPRLTTASVAYMINNVSSNTITITLHATAYAAATADADVTAALAAHTNVSLASAT